MPQPADVLWIISGLCRPSLSCSGVYTQRGVQGVRSSPTSVTHPRHGINWLFMRVAYIIRGTGMWMGLRPAGEDVGCLWSNTSLQHWPAFWLMKHWIFRGDARWWIRWTWQKSLKGCICRSRYLLSLCSHSMSVTSWFRKQCIENANLTHYVKRSLHLLDLVHVSI